MKYKLKSALIAEIMEKLDMDKLTDKIAEKAAELIVQKEYSSIPITNPSNPWIAPGSIKPDHLFEDVVAKFRPTCVQDYIGDIPV